MKKILELALTAVFAYLMMPIVCFFAGGFLWEFWINRFFSVSLIDTALDGNIMSVLFWVAFSVFNIKKAVEWYLFSDFEE